MDILALDFDGVICDSAAEAGVAGWKAAARLWPDRFRGDTPAEIIESFRQVRPVMETGYESILLVRLLRDGCPVDNILKNSNSLFSCLMHDESIPKDELVHVFGKTRDAWMADDLQSWLDMHDFYEGTVNAVNRSDVPAYIITTKEKRFALALCDAVGLRVAKARVFGLESGKKSDVLGQLSRRYENARFHFVEDRFATLIQMTESIDFYLRLYFADWGYNTANDRDRAENTPEIEVLTQDQFPEFVKSLNFTTKDKKSTKG